MTAQDSRKHDQPSDGYLTIGDVAARLHICRASVYALIRANAFPIYRPIGSRIRVKAAELDAYVQSTADTGR